MALAYARHVEVELHVGDRLRNTLPATLLVTPAGTLLAIPRAAASRRGGGRPE